MASIIRAYYTWIVARDTDYSYRLVALFLCAPAELAIGIIVGSLPVMPKFFQHASFKASEALSYGSKSAVKPGQDSKGITNAHKANGLASIKRAFAKYKAGSDVTGSWGDLHYPRADHHGEYLTLTEFDLSSLQATGSLQPQALSGGTATRREDLEYGPHASWAICTVGLKRWGRTYCWRTHGPFQFWALWIQLVIRSCWLMSMFYQTLRFHSFQPD